MFTLLFRKMRNTKWMVICLLVGFVMASAMMSTIPIYMNASLQRMLVKDMEAFQIENDIYPGLYEAVDSHLEGDTVSAQLKEIETFHELVIDNYKDLGIPDSYIKSIAIDKSLYVKSIEQVGSTNRFSVGGMAEIEDHVKIVDGRMFKKGQRDDGVFEVIATEKTLKNIGVTVGTVYEIENIFGKMPSVKIEIVGMFEQKSDNDSYWSEGIDSAYVSTVFMDYDTFVEEAMKTKSFAISQMCERIVMNYPKMDMTNLSEINEKIEAQKQLFAKKGISFKLPAETIFKDYEDRASQLKLILWLLQIPVMLMIVFYLFMVSQLNVEQEKNEIAVFKSRGASSMQIMAIYALESLVLGVATAIIGPFVGLALCQVLGASNGFLEFVNRTALPVRLTLSAFGYALVAVAVFFVTTMVPIFPATKVTIVAHKQSKAKKNKKPLWQKAFFDIILLAGSIAWLYYYNITQENLIKEGLSKATATINPMLFVASTAFILGAGLLVMRIYPLVVRIIYAIGKRFWSPAAYVSLNNIGRSSTGREKFIMTFLILTVSLGIFFANTARALNSNAEDRVRYQAGADVVMSEKWYSSAIDEAQSQGPTSMGGVTVTEPEEEEEDASELYYIEPAIERFEELAGVKDVTKVFTRDDAIIRGDTIAKENKVEEDDRNNNWGWEQEAQNRTTSTVTEVNVMGVIPAEFAEIAWFRDDLLPTHINNYLNALAKFPSGILLSSSFEDYGVKLGDTVQIKWGKNDYFEATVVAFIDYWPSINPYDKNSKGEYTSFAVMNFDYMRVNTAVEPYDVWIDLEEGATIEEFYKSIEESDIEGEKYIVASQNVISEKNDPMLQGMNGALTLGFIIIMIMCIIGFLIYWILSIKSRTLQFGILRAMGMTYREIIAMIIYEQLLVSGVAIVVAIVIGGIASDLFVPLFQTLYDAIERVPAFVVAPLRSDYLKIYAVVGLMLLGGFFVLYRIIKKIKISQALKLGED
ncbi:MAG: FtsX-like permease family protein [Oscillospiraceae bacterium]|nr:FtsX-like permease family protein [Oscillospiraceae bacterium]